MAVIFKLFQVINLIKEQSYVAIIHYFTYSFPSLYYLKTL